VNTFKVNTEVKGDSVFTKVYKVNPFKVNTEVKGDSVFTKVNTFKVNTEVNTESFIKDSEYRVRGLLI
jgi:hypothetical protein